MFVCSVEVVPREGLGGRQKRVQDRGLFLSFPFYLFFGNTLMIIIIGFVLSYYWFFFCFGTKQQK